MTGSWRELAEATRVAADLVLSVYYEGPLSVPMADAVLFLFNYGAYGSFKSSKIA